VTAAQLSKNISTVAKATKQNGNSASNGARVTIPLTTALPIPSGPHRDGPTVVTGGNGIAGAGVRGLKVINFLAGIIKRGHPEALHLSGAMGSRVRGPK
jgi:hypothetical protein